MTEAKTKVEVATNVRNEILDRFVRNDIDVLFFDEEVKAMPHGKERAEKMQQAGQTKENVKKTERLLRVIDRKIAAYRKEEKE